jgi:ribonuclease HII
VTPAAQSGRPAAPPAPAAHLRWERKLTGAGWRAIAGLDEAGRGAWAGPLVAAAVLLPAPSRVLKRRLAGLRDSKQLSAAQRARLLPAIQATALAFGLGIVEAPLLDALGLGAAGRLALERAAEALPLAPDYLLIDAFRLPALDCPQEAIVRGDAQCLSIAAASVLAKVERDRLMTDLSRQYPEYGFERHKGYGTSEHLRALTEHGPCPEHRFSYGPIQAIVQAAGRA